MESKLALVVEDDAAVGGAYAEALRQAGFATELLTSSRAALARLAEVTPAIVMLDLNLPVVSGEAVLQFIRDDARLAATRVILSTGYAHRAKALQPQADLVLVKPVSATQLIDLATRLVTPGLGPLYDAAQQDNKP